MKPAIYAKKMMSYGTGKDYGSKVLPSRTADRFEYWHRSCQAISYHSLEYSPSTTENFFSGTGRLSWNHVRSNHISEEYIWVQLLLAAYALGRFIMDADETLLLQWNERFSWIIWFFSKYEASMFCGNDDVIWSQKKCVSLHIFWRIGLFRGFHAQLLLIWCLISRKCWFKWELWWTIWLSSTLR